MRITKLLIAALLLASLLAGCASSPAETSAPTATPAPTPDAAAEAARLAAEAAEAEAARIEAEKLEKYETALALLEEKDYEGAYPLFLELGDYSDAADYAADFFILREGTIVQYDMLYKSGGGHEQGTRHETSERLAHDMRGWLMWRERFAPEDPENWTVRTETQWSDNGCLLHQTVTSIPDGTVTTYECDPAGNVIAAAVEDSETGEITRTEYENVFWDSGILRQQTQTFDDETITGHYDETGRLLSEDISNRWGNFQDVYTYNEHGNVTQRRRYEYMGEGFTELSPEVYSGDDYVWEYGEDGNVCRHEHYDPDGTLLWYYTYTREEFLGISLVTGYAWSYADGTVRNEEHYTYRLVYDPEL
ncbi:MAG: hypothetical protein E7463_15455 [Ruminococcaceae bacterium]|nr:hypothetical protein [Oscillospiraceae bacterium]